MTSSTLTVTARIFSPTSAASVLPSFVFREPLAHQDLAGDDRLHRDAVHDFLDARERARRDELGRHVQDLQMPLVDFRAERHRDVGGDDGRHRHFAAPRSTRRTQLPAIQAARDAHDERQEDHRNCALS